MAVGDRPLDVLQLSNRAGYRRAIIGRKLADFNELRLLARAALSTLFWEVGWVRCVHSFSPAPRRLLFCSPVPSRPQVKRTSSSPT